ncbi:MAG: hypothetical protein IID40_10720, partial [Planctomycetes bacterium]|nr:hypothetical protein [Planctomycetota bacterium]
RPNQGQAWPADNGRRGRNNHSDRPVRRATASQVRAIRAIAQKQQLDPDRLANQRFRVNDLEELTIREASTLIDELKAAPSHGGNGGGR